MPASAVPLVDIGLAVYNAERVVSRAIDSLLAQDYPCVRLTISDNASTDSTPAICERYARSDSRVVFTRNETNLGASANFLKVLHLAKGPFFMWSAADDYWAPRFVSSLVAELQRLPSADVAMSAVACVDPAGAPLSTIRFLPPNGKAPNRCSSLELFKRIQYGEPLHLYLYGLYRTAFIKTAMPALLPKLPSMDVHFLAEIALATRFGYVDEVLYTRTMHKTPAHVRYPTEDYARVEREGTWTPAVELAFLRDWIWKSRLIPLHRKVLALTWLRCRAWNLRTVPGGGLLHWLNRTFTRRVG